MTQALIYAIGFIAQGFFSARMIIQWVMSERAHRSVSPNLYWICSLVGSVLLFSYGWLRHDFSIIFGQLISYYIYIWNLDIKGVWHRLPLPLRAFLFSLPAAAVALMLSEAATFVENFFRNEKVPLWLVVFGSAGQFIFTVRFVYQWYYSYHRHESFLPIGFWVISIIGSGIIVAYGCFRLDPVLILGQSVGFITYTRNIMLEIKRQRRENKEHQV
ncbi:MAG: lipid-A-disaccharide synthase N-terminal domain-containing protein [Prevotella sp.]|nr:lipid-A-disaccharide synthase N-terminal domain-containing protein [Prevotella sp.]